MLQAAPASAPPPTTTRRRSLADLTPKALTFRWLEKELSRRGSVFELGEPPIAPPISPDPTAISIEPAAILATTASSCRPASLAPVSRSVSWLRRRSSGKRLSAESTSSSALPTPTQAQGQADSPAPAAPPTRRLTPPSPARRITPPVAAAPELGSPSSILREPMSESRQEVRRLLGLDDDKSVKFDGRFSDGARKSVACLDSAV